MSHDPDAQPIEDQTAHLEQALIDDFIRMRGHDPAHLGALPAEERELLLKQAALYAASKLTEVEARAHYVHNIHGER
jgi:hypothetical protein